MKNIFVVIVLVLCIISTLTVRSTKTNDLLFFDEFEYEFDLINERDGETQNAFMDDDDGEHSQSASKCTHRIPVIFHHLCVDWNPQNGFWFKYESNLNDESLDDLHQTDWFYAKRADKMSSALLQRARS